MGLHPSRRRPGNWKAALIFFAVVSTPGTGAAGQQPAGTVYTISGVITDASANPLGGTEVALVRESPDGASKDVTRTGADGAFSFSGITGGRVYLKVRRPGYRALVVQMRPDTIRTTRPFRVVMDPVAVELAAVEVEAQASQGMKDFEDRRRTRGTGHFIDRAEIEKRRPAYTSDMLHTYPGMSVRPGKVGNAVKMRGCKPSVWIDGVQAQGAELDEVTRPGDIDGIEVYNS
ncbi:MAG TPA: carboxypeptidase-like regulatory domain-containing protein, partial [Gemmatimonadaceae bacterium]|nr:carboxypeptidase-like regulatory domain-containing protein [Gemmatimonadaceae bacterium]